MIQLIRVRQSDLELLQQMIKSAFSSLLEHYRDYDTNPACESSENISRKIDSSDYYFILHNGIKVGGIRIVHTEDTCRISPIFILPEYRRHGYAAAAMLKAEEMYKGVHCFLLDTIKQEENLLRLYTNLGYIPDGREYNINDNMTIIYLEKNI